MASTEQTGTRSARVGIIGAGFGGLAMAARLRQSGRDDFIVLDAGAAIGGTWRDNDYPGCACDVPSNLYCYSFALNPGWTTTFAHQGEIRSYIERVAADHDLHRSVHLDTFVQDAVWDEKTLRWQVDTNQGRYEFEVLVPATGPLSSPSIPDLPGLSEFKGPVFHSARWDHSVDLTGKRVAVVGTGASAIQFIPELQKIVGELKLFQRTPPWLLPRPEYKTSRLRRALFRRLPLLQRAARAVLYWGHETYVIAFTRQTALLKILEVLARRQIKRQIPDNPALRAAITPNFAIGCKRILLSSNYYPALNEPNVEVLTTGIAGVTEHGVIGTNGETREVDAIVLGTGFHVTDLPFKDHIRGRAGRTVGEVWGPSMSAYRGSTVPGFPNLFMILGPNTGLGHTSMIYMIEAAAQYALSALEQMDARDIAAVEVRPERADQWNADVQARMPQTIWAKGGCASWYFDETGRNSTLWPDFTFRFKAQTKRFDMDAYLATPARIGGSPSSLSVVSPGARD